MRYSIDQGLLRHPLEVEIDGVPPCLFCGEPVTSPSMDGPLVCGACDCGRNRGGSKWTEAQAEERYAHRRSMVATYRVQMIDRRVREMKELLAKMTSHVRYTAIETGESREEGGTSASVAFMAAAWKLMPDLIEVYALRGEEVAKWADASGTAKGECDVLRREVTELRAALVEACDLAPQTERVTELRSLANAPAAVATVVASSRVGDLLGASTEERDRGPWDITIGNRSQFTGAVDQLRTSLRAALEKLQPERILKLRSLIDDPRRSCGGANQGDYERVALPELLAALPDLLAAYEEVAKLTKDAPFVTYELAKGGPWP